MKLIQKSNPLRWYSWCVWALGLLTISFALFSWFVGRDIPLYGDDHRRYQESIMGVHVMSIGFALPFWLSYLVWRHKTLSLTRKILPPERSAPLDLGLPWWLRPLFFWRTTRSLWRIWIMNKKSFWADNLGGYLFLLIIMWEYFMATMFSSHGGRGAPILEPGGLLASLLIGSILIIAVSAAMLSYTHLITVVIGRYVNNPEQEEYLKKKGDNPGQTQDPLLWRHR